MPVRPTRWSAPTGPRTGASSPSPACRASSTGPAPAARSGREDLIADERFTSHEQLAANAGEAREILTEIFASAPLSEWKDRLDSFEGQWAVAQDSLELTTDPQVVANGLLGETATADGTPFTLVTTPVQFAGRAVAAEAGARVQRALRRDPRRHRLRRRRDDGAQGGRGRRLSSPGDSVPAGAMTDPAARRCSSSSASAASSATSPCCPPWPRRPSRRSPPWAGSPPGPRAAGVQVAHLTYLPLAGGRSASRRSPLMRATASDGVAGATTDPALEIVPEIGVGPDDLVLPRHQGISPVHRTEVLTILRNMGMDEVVVAGVSTNLAIPLVAVGRGRRGLRRHRGDATPPWARRPSTTRPCCGTAWPSWPASPRPTSCWPSGRPEP